jgi:hypothetical protein
VKILSGLLEKFICSSRDLNEAKLNDCRGDNSYFDVSPL